jgi:hypothetical protein
MLKAEAKDVNNKIIHSLALKTSHIGHPILKSIEM